jgi:transposase
MGKRRTFSREFKLEAIRMLNAGGKKISDLSRELGVPRNALYKWRDELAQDGQEGAFPGTGRQSSQAAELSALKKEIDRLREENEILKKAARYFAKELP